MSISECPKASYDDEGWKILCDKKEICGNQRLCGLEGRYVLAPGARICLERYGKQKKEFHFSLKKYLRKIFKKIFKNN